jgi:L-2-hydroxyglutarate oxidase
MALAVTSRANVVVLEAEDHLAAHQSGHNTGVIHSGIFYKPGSLFARLCVEGREALYRFCQDHGVAHERCGKVIIAAEESDLPGLDELERRGRENGLHGVQRLTGDQIKDHELHAAGVAGLFVPEAGIVDYAEVTRAYADQVRKAGGTILTAARVQRVRREGAGFVLDTAQGRVQSRSVVNCGGLQADRIARMCGVDPGVQVIPFRGQFYELAPERQGLVRALIYPVPDLSLPFLGVHITRTIHGTVQADPNGALVFRREGYKFGSVSLRDLLEMVTYRGFWRMVIKHLGTGVLESVRSASELAFVKPLQKLIPELRPEDFHATRAGVHAQAVEPSGAIVDDFRLIQAPGMVHVLNATSPAATSSIRLGEVIASMVANEASLASP